MSFEKVGGFEEKNPLTDDQLKLAEVQIDDLHPINGTAIHVAFPWACCCIKKYKEMNAEDLDNAPQDKQQQLKE